MKKVLLNFSVTKIKAKGWEDVPKLAIKKGELANCELIGFNSAMDTYLNRFSVETREKLNASVPDRGKLLSVMKRWGNYSDGIFYMGVSRSENGCWLEVRFVPSSMEGVIIILKGSENNGVFEMELATPNFA